MLLKGIHDFNFTAFVMQKPDIAYLSPAFCIKWGLIKYKMVYLLVTDAYLPVPAKPDRCCELVVTYKYRHF